MNIKRLLFITITSFFFLSLPLFLPNQPFACAHVLPELLSVNPSITSPGSSVSVSGRNFQVGGLQVVYEDGGGTELLTADYMNESQISFNAPSRPTIGKGWIYVHTCGGSTNTYPFTIEDSKFNVFCKYAYDCYPSQPTPTLVKLPPPGYYLSTPYPTTNSIFQQGINRNFYYNYNSPFWWRR